MVLVLALLILGIAAFLVWSEDLPERDYPVDRIMEDARDVMDGINERAMQTRQAIEREIRNALDVDRK